MAWSQALSGTGHAIPMSSVHRLIGKGGTELLEALLRRDDREIHDAHRAAFERLLPRAQVLPGAAELVEVIHHRGIRVVLVTSSKPSHLPPLLDLLGEARESIDEVVHGEEGTAEPAPDLYRLAMSRCQLEPGDVLAAGDAEWDVRAAGAAGIATVAVRTGGIPDAVLTGAGALAIYDSCADIVEHWYSSPFAA